MNSLETKLAKHFLNLAADEFANHGSNDFELKAFIPKLADRQRFVKEYHEWNGDPEEYDPKAKYDYFPDFAIMSFLASKIWISNQI